jgi:hypothetical protein
MRIVPVAAALVIAGAAIGVTAATASASDSPAASSNGSVFIVGGSTAGQSYPWAAALTYSDGFQECTGSLIASQWVVTAKHCLSDVRQVRVGSKDYTTGGTLVRVAKTVSGPDDIGLVKLAQAVPYAPVGIAPRFGDARPRRAPATAGRTPSTSDFPATSWPSTGTVGLWTRGVAVDTNSP